MVPSPVFDGRTVLENKGIVVDTTTGWGTEYYLSLRHMKLTAFLKLNIPFFTGSRLPSSLAPLNER